LKNFRYSLDEVKTHEKTIKVLDDLNLLQNFASEHNPTASWLTTATATVDQSLISGDQSSDLQLSGMSSWLVKKKQIKEEIFNQINQELRSQDPEIAKLSSEVGKKLKELKDEYINQYISLHSRARLGVNDDKRKAALIGDNRHQTLKKLAGIDLMPKQQLTDYQKRLADLKSCFDLTRQDLDNYPICPHCHFHTVADIVISGSDMLQQLDDELDRIMEQWIDILINNLEDPITQININELLQDEDKKQVQAFIDSRQLPDVVDSNFVQTLKTILAGLQKVVIRKDDLLKTVSELGPATPDKIKSVLIGYVDELTKGKDPQKVRIVLEE
jgi:hypothetical protein